MEFFLNLCSLCSNLNVLMIFLLDCLEDAQKVWMRSDFYLNLFFVGVTLRFCSENFMSLSNLRQFFHVQGQRFWSLITRTKPAKIVEPPLFGRRAARFATSSSLFSTYLVVISSDFNTGFCVAHTAVRRW